MGMSGGGVIGPLVAGYLAQQIDWHLGFACAGVGMVLGLVQYVAGRRHLEPGIARLGAQSPSTATAAGERTPRFTPAEWERIAAGVGVFLFAPLFLGALGPGGFKPHLFAGPDVRAPVPGIQVFSQGVVSVHGRVVD